MLSHASAVKLKPEVVMVVVTPLVTPVSAAALPSDSAIATEATVTAAVTQAREIFMEDVTIVPLMLLSAGSSGLPFSPAAAAVNITVENITTVRTKRKSSLLKGKMGLMVNQGW